MAKPALGKGLGALIPSKSAAAREPALARPAIGDVVQRVTPDRVVASPLQPRREFQAEQLSELVESIREHGIIQPLIVREVAGKLELIAGERRYRAACELGLKELPVIVREASDQDVLEMALIENLQREGLNPIEEARAYQRLAAEFSMRQEDIARRVGKNRATVANAIRLLDLAEVVQESLVRGEMAAGHAKVLLQLKDAKAQLQAAKEVVAKGLTVRATEKLVQGLLNPPQPKAKPASPGFSADVAEAVEACERRLTEHLSTHVKIRHSEKKGVIEIDYYGNDDLGRLLSLMGMPEDL
jgi:ParB family chromosome partitioning protein